MRQVYQGTLHIDRDLLKGFLKKCWQDENVPKPVMFGLIEELIIDPITIKVLPEIFDEDKPETEENRIYLGDLTLPLELCFRHFFSENWFGIIESLPEFGKNHDPVPFGGDPQYISWCLRNVADFYIDPQSAKELSALKSVKLTGIQLLNTNHNLYEYTPLFEGIRNTLFEN